MSARPMEDESSNASPEKTLVVYSGPTSMDRLQDKNGMYKDNMDYFLKHGVSCFDDVPNKDNTGKVVVNYIFVLTKEVADYYTAPNGPIRKKIEECKGVQGGQENSLISVVTRLDRCYDMESIRTVVTQINVQALYDSLLFINCGLVGPKFGPGTPKFIPSRPGLGAHANQTMGAHANQTMVPYSHWSQLYTSMLSDSVKLVGHSINTHLHTFFPHVQSFLFALSPHTLPLLISSGAIYDCNLTQEELGSSAEKRLELITRYEVGMSTQLLNAGFKIAIPFVNRYGFGRSLVYDKDSTWGTEMDDTISDIWYEDGIRNLTATKTKPTPKWWETKEQSGLRNMQNRHKDTFEYHQWDILPWDHFVFFKVSRLVPEDIQQEMQYDATELAKNGISVVNNDPRKSFNKYWLKKTGVYIEPTHLDYFWKSACLVVLGLFAKRKRLHHFKKV